VKTSGSTSGTRTRVLNCVKIIMNIWRLTTRPLLDLVSPSAPFLSHNHSSATLRKGASLFILSAMRPTNSSLNDLVGASLMAAIFLCPRGTMCDTNSTLLDVVATSLVIASLQLCPMPVTKLLPDILHIGTSLMAASLFSLYACLDIRLGLFFGNRIFLQLYHHLLTRRVS
jgi:hypothetical protein